MRQLTARAQLVAACGLCALLRLPAFRYDLISDDEAIYDAMARTLAAGGVMYRDAVDHKPPGLAYTYALCYRLAHGDGAVAMALVHLLGLLAAVATCVALYFLARRLLAEPLWTLPPLLYAVVSACKQPADGLAVNGELLMNLPVALCALSALAAGEARSRLRSGLFDLLAGALGAVAALYKYQGAVVLFALPLLWAGGRSAARAAAGGERSAGHNIILTLFQRGAATLLGVLLPLALVAAWFRSRGALGDAIGWGLAFNRNYVAEGSPPLWALQRFGLQLAGVVLPGALLYGAGLVGLLHLLRGGAGAEREVVSARAFLACWTLFSLASVALGLRFFGHYFLQPELPLALLAAGPARRLFAARPRLAAAALWVPALVFLFLAAAPELSRPLFNARDPDYRGIGRAVAARTAPSDTIWVWGNVPQLYHASARALGVRFSFCNYLTGLSPGTPSEYDDARDPRGNAVAAAWSLVLQDLEAKKPALVLDTAAAGIKSYGKFPVASFPLLSGYLATHYRPEGDVQGVVFYRRVR